MSEAPLSDDPTSISASRDARSSQVHSPRSGLPAYSTPSGETGKPQVRSPEVIEGTITRIKWPRTGHHAGEHIGAVVNGVTVIGTCDTAPRAGDRIQASGGRIGSSKWGSEYRAASIGVLPPVQHDAQSRMLQMEGVTANRPQANRPFWARPIPHSEKSFPNADRHAVP